MKSLYRLVSVSDFIVWNVSCNTVYAKLVFTLIFSPLSLSTAVDITLLSWFKINKSSLPTIFIPDKSNGLLRNTTCLPNNAPNSVAILCDAVSGGASLTLP